MNIDDLIDNLNKDLVNEYSAMIQYLQHSYLLKGPERFAIVPELTQHANDEYAHAQTIGAEIVRLGGIPTVDLVKNEIVLDNVQMLEQDLEWENEAITDYKQRIKEAEELGEHGLVNHLEDILVMEEEHAQDLKLILNR